MPKSPTHYKGNSDVVTLHSSIGKINVFDESPYTHQSGEYKYLKIHIL